MPDWTTDEEWSERRAVALHAYDRACEVARAARHEAIRLERLRAESYGEYMRVVNERRTVAPPGDPLARHVAKAKR